MKSRLVGLLAMAMLPVATPAVAAQSPRIVHFDLAKGQQPENIALEPDGSADVTFTVAAQVARVRPNGGVQILATFPAGGFVSGIARAGNGTLYVNYFGNDQAGVWRIRPGRAPERIATLRRTASPTGSSSTAPICTSPTRPPARSGRSPAARQSNGCTRPSSSHRHPAGSASTASNCTSPPSGFPFRANNSCCAFRSSGTVHPARSRRRATGLGIDDFAFSGRTPTCW